MAGSNTFSRLLIVNGQPILFKDDLGLNSVHNFNSNILQQAIDDVTSTDTLSPVVNSSSSDDLLTAEQSSNGVTGSLGRNEFVTVLTNDHSGEETSTISLTLEQAAELGLHFAVDSLDQSLEQSAENKLNPDSSLEQNQFIIANDNDECMKLDSNLSSSISEDVDLLNKSKDNDSYLESFHSVSSPQHQQLTLVPQIINGAVTYTLQFSNQTLSETSNNEFFRINESSILAQDSDSAENVLKLDLGSLTASSDLPFINSPVDIVPSKSTGNSDCNTDNQPYGLISCNTENITFLNLSDAIPAGTSISNIVTHVNNITTQQSKLSNLCRPTDVDKLQHTNKLFSNQHGESLLLKQRNLSTSQCSSNVTQSQNYKSKSKMIEKFGSIIRPGFIPKSTSVINEHSDSRLNISIQPNVGSESFLEFSASATENIKTDEENSRQPEEDLVTTLNNEGRNGERSTDSTSDVRLSPTVRTPRAGDVPKEVSVALSRIPIKTDLNKPLGSTENPIQLVQQGTTFHSMQALTEDHISKIKPLLQENFDTKMPSKNVVYDPASNTRIIYRIISPSEVSLRKQEEFPRRRGRPKKVRSLDSQPEEIGDGAPPPKKNFPRTRSGRLSRPPKHMVRDYKHIRRAELDDSDGAYSDYQSEHEDEPAGTLTSAPVDLLPGLATKRKSHKRNISAGNLCPTCGKIYLGYVRMKRHFDKYPDHGSIEYLNTIRNAHPDSEAENHRHDGGNGLWKKGSGRRKGKGKNNCFMTADKRTRLKEALEWCSEAEVGEVAGPAVASVLSLWELLLLRVDAVKQDSRVAALYQEMCQLLCKLRHMARRLFRPLDHSLPTGTKHVTVQVEDEIMTGLLNLPCGVYLASDEDLDDSSDPSAQKLQTQESEVTPPLPLIEKKAQVKNILESKMKIDIDVPQPFLMSSEEMVCDTDDRSLVNVDEIVSERLQNFTGSQSSSVDELMKGLNELEQRNKLEADDLMEGFSIVSRRTHVSASTEDLMKSLAHFESDLNHPDAPSTLDRDTFDRVSNVDTLDFEVLSREFHTNNR